MADLRAAVSALREGAALDLRPALAALAGSVSRPRVHLTVPEDMGLHDAARAHALFRWVQEIVTNAVRHARAENLWIALERNHGGSALDPMLAERVRRLVDAYQAASVHQLLDTLVGELEKRAGVADAHTEFFCQRHRGLPQQRLGLGLSVIGFTPRQPTRSGTGRSAS